MSTTTVQTAMMASVIAVGQPEWANMASLGLIAAFLVWSLVQILNMIFKSWQEQVRLARERDAETIQALREDNQRLLGHIVERPRTDAEPR